MPAFTKRFARKASQKIISKEEAKVLNLDADDIRVESTTAYDLQSMSDAGTSCLPRYLRLPKRTKPTNVYSVQDPNTALSESRHSRMSVATNELGIKKGKTLKKAKSMVVLTSSGRTSGRSSANEWDTIEEVSIKASEAEDVPILKPSNPKMPGRWPSSSPKPADSEKTPTLVTTSSGAVEDGQSQDQESYRSSIDTVRHRPFHREAAYSSSSLPQSLEPFPSLEDDAGQQLDDSPLERIPSDVRVRLLPNPDIPSQTDRHPLMKENPQQVSKFSFSSSDTTETKGKGKAVDSSPSFLKDLDQRLRNLPTLQTSSTLSTLASLMTKEPLPKGKTLRHTSPLPKDRRWASLETNISSGQELLEQAELKTRLLERAAEKATNLEEKKAWGDLSSEFSQSLRSLAHELGVTSQSLPASNYSISAPPPPRTARRQLSKNFSRPFSTSSFEPVIAPRSRGPAPKFGFDSRAFSINTDEAQSSANDTFFGHGASIYALPPPAPPLPSVIEDDDTPPKQPETVFAAIYDATHRALVLVHKMRTRYDAMEERLAYVTGQGVEFERLYHHERARADEWEYRARVLTAEAVIRQAEAQGRDPGWVVQQLRAMNVPLPEGYGYDDEGQGQMEEGLYVEGGEEEEDEMAEAEGESNEGVEGEGSEEGYDADQSTYQQGDVAYTSPMRQDRVLSSSMVWQADDVAQTNGEESNVSYSAADVTDTSNISEFEI